ncbi:unnamed protein product [Pseudo-nitzschia multistriata]|uniref:PFU domain-containing protein n=1 Tax=Pseudo-nitzschia multistriata TaxID=183589 RepID=A0A448ZRT2_9STRA|nr:unnamed protein product [Pseudo-nitzschia multistriata]
MQADWEVSRQLVSDGRGVRVACILPPSNPGADRYRILAGDQGGGLCEFGIPSGSLRPIGFRHDHAVTALLSSWAPSCTGSGRDPVFYASGCKDSHVRVFDAATHEPIATLRGHEKPVTSMAFARPGSGDASAGSDANADANPDSHSNANQTPFLVTGSWDGTAKVWDVRRQALLATLPGHENSTCVAGLPPLEDQSRSVVRIATGSAGLARNNQIEGHTVRIWSVDLQKGEVRCVQSVANDHHGPIRDIATLGSIGTNNSSSSGWMATCSNDGSVRLRSNTTGDSVSILTFLHQQSSHPPMLLSVGTILDDESRTTDIVASAEDGHVVVWNSPEEEAETGALSVSEPQVVLHPSCVWSAMGLPGGDFATCCQDGTLRIFTRTSDRMAPRAEREAFAQAVQEAHAKKQSGPSPEEVAKLPAWEARLQKRGTSEGQVQLFNKAGVAIAAQWSASSQTWIEVGQVMGSSDSGTVDGVRYDHVLPIEVDQTGGGVAKLQIGYNDGENQFVAAQRFIDAHMLPQHHLNEIANYIEQRAKSEGRTLGGPPAGATSSAPAAAASGMPMATYEHLPAPAYKSFELSAKSAATTLEKMKKKIAEHGGVSESQLAAISSLSDTLAATNRYHSSRIQPSELETIARMLETLPRAEVFPALDLARLVVAHPSASGPASAGYWTAVVDRALALCTGDDNLAGPAAVAIPMLSLRLFANAFRGGPGSLEAVGGRLTDVLACSQRFLGSANKNVRLSAATLLYNTSFYVFSNPDNAPQGAALAVVSQAGTVLRLGAFEREALVRTLVALGTVAMASPGAREAARSASLSSLVEPAASLHGDLARALAREVYSVLS